MVCLYINSNNRNRVSLFLGRLYVFLDYMLLRLFTVVMCPLCCLYILWDFAVVP